MQQLKIAGAYDDKIAVIGYCFGGTGALETARANFSVKGVVSIHGGLGKDSTRNNGPLNTKILIENPAEDGGVTPQVMNNLVKEMNEGKADWQIITYAYSKHTFTDPASPDYNEVMAKRAWSHTLLFLGEVFEIAISSLSVRVGSLMKNYKLTTVTSALARFLAGRSEKSPGHRYHLQRASP